MYHRSIANIVDSFLGNHGLIAPMQVDGNATFWSYQLPGRLMVWISEANDSDSKQITASVTFGKLSEGYDDNETLLLLETTFSLPQPLHFTISEVGLVSIGFEQPKDETELLELLGVLHETALDFPMEMLIGIERLPLAWFEQS